MTLAWLALLGGTAYLTAYSSAHLLQIRGPFYVRVSIDELLCRFNRLGPGWGWFLQDHWPELAAFGAVQLGALTAGVVVYRRCVRRSLQAKVQQLTSGQADELRASLRGESWAVRQMVSPLLWGGHFATELAPAAAPDDRGNEASPADDAS